MSAKKSIPLTKEEVMELVELVQANPVLFSKATNASNNQLKEACWYKITDQFNAMTASSSRKPEQLKLKWEKRNTKMRMNNLKTGGGKPEYIPQDDELDKVAAILVPTCDGYSVQFGGDAVVDMVEDIVVNSVEETSFFNVPFDNDNILPFNTENTPLVVPTALSPAYPTVKKFFFSSAKSKGKLKREAVADDLKASIINRNRAITEYYDAKRKHEEIIGALKRKKMGMEILNLEKTLYPSKYDMKTNNDDP